MSRVTVVGSINIDLTSYLDRWPHVGETVMTKKTLISLGGKGANQAVAVSRMGAKSALVGAIGHDAFGHDVSQRLKDHNVSLHLSKQTGCSTGMAFIDVGPEGGNLIRISSGANGTLTSQIIDAHSKTISNSNVVLLQNEIPFEASLAAAKIARASGAIVVMDPAPTPVPFWSLDALAAFDILTPNSHEAHFITGREPRSLREALEAAQKLSEICAKGGIVTMGSMGVAWFIDGQGGIVEAPKVKAIDTVAAGDCFNGAFAASLASGNPIDASIRVAVEAASLTTTRRGAADSIPTFDEMKLLMGTT